MGQTGDTRTLDPVIWHQALDIEVASEIGKAGESREDSGGVWGRAKLIERLRRMAERSVEFGHQRYAISEQSKLVIEVAIIGEIL